jgi:hypothetical protein
MAATLSAALPPGSRQSHRRVAGLRSGRTRSRGCCVVVVVVVVVAESSRARRDAKRCAVSTTKTTTPTTTAAPQSSSCGDDLLTGPPDSDASVGMGGPGVGADDFAIAPVAAARTPVRPRRAPLRCWRGPRPLERSAPVSTEPASFSSGARVALRRAVVPLIAAAGLWLVGARSMAIVALGVAGLLGALWVVAPGVARRLDLGGVRVARVVGAGLGAVLLAGVFFVVVTPLGVVMRARGGDPLRRRGLRAGESGWVVLGRRGSSASERLY